ncbi:MAG: MetQ/NlpA family ABC transporter substrate-binding protein [Clostridia bacterium]
MKKLWYIALALLLAVSLPGCGSKKEDKTIKVGASASPHAEILEAAKPLLEKEGYTLEIVEFSDYVLPNESLNNKELDANYFQHEPYMQDFNEKKNGKLLAAAYIHFEPMSAYSKSISKLDELKDGDTVAIPNDTTNEARALNLLQAQGLIKLKEGVGLEATPLDIVENLKNLQFSELAAEQLPRALDDAAMAVINSNYALSGNVISYMLEGYRRIGVRSGQTVYKRHRGVQRHREFGEDPGADQSSGER